MSRLFTIASDETLCAMVQYAQEKLVIVAPGLSKKVATAIAERIKQNDAPSILSIILDVDPEVCRLGYGDIETLDILNAALELRHDRLQTQKGVRIGLVIADSEILVFSPTPRYIEAGSTSNDKPNAIRITDSSAQDLVVACGATHDESSVVKREIGLEFANTKVIKDTKEDLEKNPPREFNLVRLERVFNYSLEFVEFSIEHYKLKTRSVQLPAELLGLVEKNLQDRIRNSFRVFQSEAPFTFPVPDPFPSEGSNNTQSPPNIQLSEKWINAEAARIRKEYLIPLGSSSYGNLILKRNRAAFEREVDRLKKLVDLYAKLVGESIETMIDDTREDLVKDLFPRIKASPPKSWQNRSVDGELSDDTIKFHLSEQLRRVFQQVDRTFSPKVVCIFKGVTYETITQDKHFQEKITEYFGEDEAAKLFSHYYASRAKQREES
jgi:hypothetical protein